MLLIRSHCIAVLVLLHCLAITLAALPAPVGAMRRAEWAEPTVQDEIQMWTDRLQEWGVEITSAQLEERVWQFARKWLGARRTLLEPFEPYFKYCGTYQSWRMFVAPHRYPSRLVVDLKVEGEWVPLYRGRDPELDWHSEWFDHDRMRSVVFRFGWGSYRRTYNQFSHWLADRAAVEFPEATHLRVRMHKVRTPTPEEVRQGTEPGGVYKSVRVIALSAEPPDSGPGKTP
jgi:hypothetical protein